jgi:predicted Zn-dependent protease with MMP-like domain
VASTPFEEHVRRALDALPDDLSRGLENVAVVVEEENAQDPGLLGLFEEAPYMPAKVTVYRRPLEQDFGHDPDLLEQEIRITVLHELAHYFGIDEDRLDELGYA